MSLAGSRRPQAESVTIDYADVLRQAVENERWRTLREVRAAVVAIKATVGTGHYDKRTGEAVKKDALTAIDRLVIEP